MTNEQRYESFLLLCENTLSKKEKKLKKNEYKKSELKKEEKQYGGSVVYGSKKKIETLHKSHDYLNKLAHNRDDESDKKLSTAYKAIKHITKSPDNCPIEYTTSKEYTRKKNPEDEDFKHDKDGYWYTKTVYPHAKKGTDGKDIKSKDKKLIHKTDANYEGNPRATQYSFKHSEVGNGYQRTTRLYPKKRIYGFAENDGNKKKYRYGDHEKVINTNGKPIYKNSEADEGGFIEY